MPALETAEPPRRVDSDVASSQQENNNYYEYLH